MLQTTIPLDEYQELVALIATDDRMCVKERQDPAGFFAAKPARPTSAGKRPESAQSGGSGSGRTGTGTGRPGSGGSSKSRPGSAKKKGGKSLEKSGRKEGPPGHTVPPAELQEPQDDEQDSVSSPERAQKS